MLNNSDSVTNIILFINEKSVVTFSGVIPLGGNIRNIYILLFITGALLFASPPDWIDDPGAYEFSATIAGGILLSDGVNMAEEGDMFAAFDENGNVRGVAVQLSPPFGPYEGEIIYEMQLRSNAAGDLLSFKYYDASEDAVFDIVETYAFEINDIIGSVV
ncbi:MAG: hypothetical protein QF380_07140, partial [Candidatus Marinimicrobia bacterium]|nr:hypothetical protein [Candidatus Neomarinimicrobiota bacterium]